MLLFSNVIKQKIETISAYKKLELGGKYLQFTDACLQDD